MAKKSIKYSKSEDYRDKVLQLIRVNSSSAIYRRIRMADNYEYYYGTADPQRYDKLLNLHEDKADSGGNTPYQKINFDSISPKINALLGDLIDEDFDITIEAYNDGAVKRKQIFETQLRFLQRQQQFQQQMSNISGVPYGMNDNIPKDEEELQDYMDNYVDTYSLLVNTAVNEKIKAYNYHDLRRMLFLDMLCGGVTAKVEEVNGHSRYRRVNMLRSVYDESARGEYQDQRTYFFEASYIPIPEAMDRWKLSKEQMQEMIDMMDDSNADNWTGRNNEGHVLFAPFIEEGSVWNNTGFGKVLIVEGEWLDIDRMTTKTTYDKHGNEHNHLYMGADPKGRDRLSRKEKMDERSNLESKGFEVERHCTLIGGHYVAEFGELDTQIRDYEDPSRTQGSYVTLIPGYNDEKSTTIFERVSTIQDFRNYIWTLLTLEVTTSMPDFIEVDKTQIDRATYGNGDDAIAKLLHTVKANKIVVVDPSQNKTWAKNNPHGQAIKNVSLQKSTKIVEYTNLIAVLDDQISSITGINESRVGQNKERQSGKANAQSINQSGQITKHLFAAFKGFESRLFEKQARHISMLWAKFPERYEKYAAQLGIYLPEDFDIDLQSYKAYVSRYPLTYAELKEAANGSVLQGNMMMHEFLELMDMASRNLRAAIQRYVKGSKKKLAQQQQMEQQRLDQQMQQQQAMQESQQQQKLMEIEKANEGRVQVAHINQDSQSEANYMQSAIKEMAINQQRADSIRKHEASQ